MKAKHKRVAYYPGCALEGTGHSYNRSTKAVGKALGLDLVELKNWNCCGAMEVKNVDPKLQTYLSARNLSIAEKMGFDTVMAPCNGCYHNLKKAEYDLSHDEASREVNGAAFDQGQARDLRGRQGRDDPRARLDQGFDRRGGAEGEGQELAEWTEGRQLLRLHVHAPAPHLPGKGQGAGLANRLRSRTTWTTFWRPPARKTSNIH